MNIILYNSSAEKNRLNKGTYLHQIISMDGTLRNTCSVLSPSIIIELDPNTVQMNILNKIFVLDDNGDNIVDLNDIKVIYSIISKIITSNYAFIPDFNRYYFITDITSLKQNLWQISMRVDVLMSYYGNIKNTYAFITRNENRYSDMIKDDMVTYYYDKDITEYVPENGAKVNYTFDSAISLLKNTYTITVVNDLSGASLNTALAPSTALPNVGGWVTGASAMSITYTTYNTQILHLAQHLLKNDTLSSYVFSLIAYPFEIPAYITSNTLVLGETSLDADGGQGLSAVDVYDLKKQFSDYMVIADFTITADSFFDYSPYSTYDMWIPYLGWINLDADQILNKRLLVIYTVDFKTGSAQVSVIDDTDGNIVFTTTTQLGVNIPVTTTNALEVENNRINNNVGLGLGLTASAVSIIGGIASYNPMLILGGIMGGASSVAKFVQNNNTNYSKASGSVGSGNSGAYLPQTVKIRKTSLKPRGYDSDYASLFGKPLNEYYKIGDLSGYTQIGDVHLEGFDNATDGELSQIESLLKSGIIV